MSAHERASILSELTPPLRVLEPVRQTAPFVFSSPHSGRQYPRAFLNASRLDPVALRKSEDTYVDELFGQVAALGAPLIAARFPRAYLDVNREPYELDPELFLERLPAYANSRSVRVVGGLGTIARIVAESEEIYHQRLSLAVAFERIEHLYRPYHESLRTAIEETRRAFGMAILVDCHSMPSVTGAPGAGSRADLVLGDRFGTSCDGGVIQFIEQELTALGFKVALNRPYAGGFITEHYGRPADGVHALQLEINRALYMDEETFEKRACFDTVCGSIGDLLANMFGQLPTLLQPPAAAE